MVQWNDMRVKHILLFTGRIRKLSRQEIFDCVEEVDRPHISLDAFNYVMKHGVTLQVKYLDATSNEDFQCKRNKRSFRNKIKGFGLLHPGIWKIRRILQKHAASNRGYRSKTMLLMIYMKTSWLQLSENR